MLTFQTPTPFPPMTLTLCLALNVPRCIILNHCHVFGAQNCVSIDCQRVSLHVANTIIGNNPLRIEVCFVCKEYNKCLWTQSGSHTPNNLIFGGCFKAWTTRSHKHKNYICSSQHYNKFNTNIYKAVQLCFILLQLSYYPHNVGYIM